jgi:HEAT repeat protein
MSSNRESFPIASGGCLNDAIMSALGQADRTLRTVAIAQATRTVDPDELVTLMADGQHAARRNAAISALTLGGSRSVPALVRALKDPDPEVVLFATGVLGKSRDPAAIPHLVSLIDHPEINVAQAAIDSISQLRPTLAVDALIRVLDRDLWLRFAAIHALGEIGDPRAVQHLLPLVADETVRDVAIEALGKIGTLDTLPTLASLLREAPDSVSFGVCLRAIGELLANHPDAESLRNVGEWAKLSAASPVLEERLREVLSPNETDLGGDADAVAEKGAAASLVRALRLRPLYATLVLAGRHPMLRELLQFCVVSIGTEIAPFLGGGLDHANSNVIVLACRAVGAMSLRQFAPRLTALLAHDVAEVRVVAAEALGALRETSAIGPLVKLLGDSSDECRQAARAALSGMDAEAVTNALLGVRGDEPVLCGALEIMRRNPSPRQLPFLRAALADGRPEVRYAAVTALGEQPAGKDLPKLLGPLLNDPVLRVRRAVVNAVGRCREQRASELLLAQIERDPSTRVEAILMLAKSGDASVVPHLMEIFDREPQPTRLVIIDALAELKQPIAEPMLVRLLADASPTIRHAAARALIRFGSAASMRHLAAAARDDDANVRGLVAGALSPSDPATRAALERLCMDPNARVASVARVRLDAERDHPPSSRPAQAVGSSH